MLSFIKQVRFGFLDARLKQVTKKQNKLRNKIFRLTDYYNTTAENYHTSGYRTHLFREIRYLLAKDAKLTNKAISITNRLSS